MSTGGTGRVAGQGDLPRDRLDVEAELEVFLKGTAEVLSRDELRKRLEKAREERRPLQVKLGADPTAPDIHLGHTVVLWKLRQIQDLGHQVTFLIGDFTGMIGDPTGKKETRPPLTREDVERNAETYKKQIFKVLDPDKTLVRFNSEWLGGLRFDDVIRLASRVTLAHMLERQDFGDRYRASQPIHLHELFYALAQGYDSVAMKTDVELGGQDQRFNFVTTRDLQKSYGQAPEIAIMMPILAGLDGKMKMSKSLGNYVGIDEAPAQIFGKAMSVSDELMWDWYRLLTDRTEAWIRAARGPAGSPVEVGGPALPRHPMEAKKDLAELLTARFHGEGAGKAARTGFEATVQHKGLPDEIPAKPVRGLLPDPAPLAQLLELCFGCSRGEARRMAEQGGVRIDGQPVKDPQASVALKPGIVVQMGKRNFVRLA